MPRQDLAVSWKMRTLQRWSPRNKAPMKKKTSTVSVHQHSSGAHVYACLYVCVCVCTMCVVLYVGYMSQRMMHVCQQGSKAPVKSKNAQSGSQPPLGENQIQIGLDKNPGAIWEAMTTSESMYGHTSHTEGGVGVSESLTRGIFSHTNHRQLSDWRKALKCCILFGLFTTATHLPSHYCHGLGISTRYL